MSQLSVDSLKEMGAFAGAPVKKTIKFTSRGQDYSGDIYVRPLSYLSVLSDLKAAATASDDFWPGRIAASICDADGKRLFSAEDITGVAEDGSPVMWANPETGDDEPRGPMCDSLYTALLETVLEVNGLGKLKS